MSDGWNPVREEFFKRTLSRDFKTIYPVSYTHLDVYKRQRLCILHPINLPFLNYAVGLGIIPQSVILLRIV